MKINKGILASFLFLLALVPAYGQEVSGGWLAGLKQMGSNEISVMIIISVTLGLIILMLILLVYLMSFLSTILDPGRLHTPGISWWARFKRNHLTGEPIKEGGSDEKMLADHSYDGIVELDNFMPPWLQYVFVFSIGFGIIYFVNYTVLGWGQTQLEEYEEEVNLATIEADLRQSTLVSTLDETNVVFDKTEASLDAGKTIFDTNCVACHASDGGGGVGPNLTDEYWLHGGEISDVFSVIKYGVPEKGMIPWQDQLSPEQMQQVSSYILTLVGNTPLNPKEPQGELYEPAIEKPVDALTEDDLELEKVEN